MRVSIKVNIWRVSGYRGRYDYDGPEDDNFCFVTALDARLTKDDVLELFFNRWSHKYRTVSLYAELLDTAEVAVE